MICGARTVSFQILTLTSETRLGFRNGSREKTGMRCRSYRARRGGEGVSSTTRTAGASKERPCIEMAVTIPC
jgi:hypothetical protein